MDKQKAIIVDIDGTLADHSNRLERLENHDPTKATQEELDDYLDQSKDDPPIEWCQNLIKLYSDNGYQIIFVTARNNRYKKLTSSWLERYVDSDVIYLLFMRSEGDDREDSYVKYDIYKTEIEPYYHVDFALDDRDSVVQMYRDDLNIPCLQVAKGVY